MQRASLSGLSSASYDVLVVGGGIYGAMAAREAALRGLRTALIERDDWGAGASYNSLKIVHGGIRYVQHLDIARLRASARERAFWQHAAPDLVRPLEFVIPLVGHGIKGPAAFAAAAALYTTLSAGVRGPGYDGTRVIGPSEARQRLGDLAPDGLTGGGVWWDGQILDANRLQLACLRAATNAGAEAANYMEVQALLHNKARVFGATVKDRVTGETAEIRAGVTLSCTGAAAAELASPVLGSGGAERFPAFARALNLVVDRSFGPRALGAISRSRSDAVIDRGGRMYFLTPWEGKMVIGTHEAPHDGSRWRRNLAEEAEFIDELNHACPTFDLAAEEVIHSYGGLIPADVDDDRSSLRRQTRGTLIDHREANGVGGLISSVGVKYTTARLIAERMVGHAQAQLGLGCCAKEGAQRSFENPLPNVDMAEIDPDKPDTLPERIRTAVREEMAITLEDVLRRRTRLTEIGALRGEKGLALQARAEKVNPALLRRLVPSTDSDR